MVIKDVVYDDLLIALETASRMFDGNIVFKRIEPTNKARTRWTVTLGVRNSRFPGGRISYSGRRVAAACWHVYGTFLDALPPYARFRSPYTNGWMMPGEEWRDWNIGSRYRPLMYSDACDCNRRNDY